MKTESHRKHLFISHHHKDDESVTKLTKLFTRRGYDIRNSSIRVKPENQKRLDQNKIKDNVLKRLLRMKISWASTVVVIVGKKTHQRPWVNWEIEQAYKQGKRIVGVFEHGGTSADLPENLKKYGDAQVSWNIDSILKAIEGEENKFEQEDGSTCPPNAAAVNVNC